MAGFSELGLNRLLGALKEGGYDILDLGRGQPSELTIHDLLRARKLFLHIYLEAMEYDKMRGGFHRMDVKQPERLRAEVAGPVDTLLLGYADDYDLDLYVAFQPEARLEPDKVVGAARVSDEALEKALDQGIGLEVQGRGTLGRKKPEIVTAFTPDTIRNFIESRPKLEELRTELEIAGPTRTPEIRERAQEVLWTPRGRVGPRFDISAPSGPVVVGGGLWDEEAADHPARTVSTGFSDGHGGPDFELERSLLAGRRHLFWLEVGEQVPHSIERTHKEIPVKLLPERAELVVALFGFEGELGLTEHDIGTLQVGEDGGVSVLAPAYEPPDVPRDLLHRRLFFPVDAPPAVGDARLRCNIYCDGVLVQSRLVTASVTEDWAKLDHRALDSRLEYSLSRSLHSGQLASLPGADLSIMLNGDGDTHEFRFFGPGDDADSHLKEEAPIPVEDVRAIVGKLRETLRQAAWGKTDEWREGYVPLYDESGSDEQLLRDLLLLAKRGRVAFHKIMEELAGRDVAKFDQLLDDIESRLGATGRIEVAAQPDRFVPAALFYDLEISTAEKLSKFSMCPTFAAALGAKAPLQDCACFQGDCPARSNPLLVCPSGFWGYRHAIGWPVSLENAGSDARGVLEYADAPAVGAAYAEDLELWDEHRARLVEILGKPKVAKTRDQVFAMLRDRDEQILYLYCHGGQTDMEVPWIRIGPKGGPFISRTDLIDRRKEFRGTQNLVFLNGCRTAAMSPEQRFSLVSAFVSFANALGVIGTEITVFEGTASLFAAAFMQSFVLDGKSVGEAVRLARLELLARRNPLGLVYVPFVLGGTELGAAAAA